MEGVHVYPIEPTNPERAPLTSPYTDAEQQARLMSPVNAPTDGLTSVGSGAEEYTNALEGGINESKTMNGIFDLMGPPPGWQPEGEAK